MSLHLSGVPQSTEVRTLCRYHLRVPTRARYDGALRAEIRRIWDSNCQLYGTRRRHGDGREVNESITLGSGLQEGEYLLTVVMKKCSIYSAEAGEFTVVSEAAPEPLSMTYVPGGTYQRDGTSTNTTTVSPFFMST